MTHSTRRIKIYQQTYELPDLSDPQFEQIRDNIKSRQQLIKTGQKEVSGGLFGLGKRVQALGFEERFQELEALVKDYDYYINLLKNNQDIYQNFFVQLANEIKKIVVQQCQTILELEQELAQLEEDGISAEELREDKRDLLITLKITEKAALLMLKQAQVFSVGLKRLAESQDKQKEVLENVLGELSKKKRHYQFKLKAAKARQKAEELAQVALNFDQTLGDLFGPLKQLVEEVIKVDEDLAKSAENIKVLVEDIMSNQQGFSRMEEVTESILNFQVSSYGQRHQLTDTFEKVREVKVQQQASYYVEDEVLDRVNITDAIGLINSHVASQLTALGNNLGLNLAQPKPILSSSVKVSSPDILTDAQQKTITEDLGKGVKLEMVLIPAGSFMMGSNDYDGEKPRHEVTLKAFYMGKYPVTQAQYEAVMGNNPSYFQNAEKAPLSQSWENHPVECVSWNDAQEFCRKLSQITGKTYQLPSESQWEYACRAGSQGKYCYGDDESKLGEYAWYSANSSSQTHAVGQKKPNKWGLYDMHGNVWEWCEDDSVDNYKNTPRDGTMYRNKSMKYIVLRGGSWYDDPYYCRSALRYRPSRDYWYCNNGFRLILVLLEHT